MSKSVGKSLKRVDAYDKATGRAKYTDDLCGREALIVKICHSTIAHGFVKRIDTAAAERIPGVVRVLTCFDVPEFPFPTAGHPWSTDPAHQDVADRLLLNRHVRYYGDEVAVVSGRWRWSTRSCPSSWTHKRLWRARHPKSTRNFQATSLSTRISAGEITRQPFRSRTL